MALDTTTKVVLLRSSSGGTGLTEQYPHSMVIASLIRTGVIKGQLGGGAPADTTLVWFDTTDTTQGPDGTAKRHNGATWVATSGLVAGSSSAVSATNLYVKSATVTAPPGGPVSGDEYIVPTGATGAWVGQVGKVAKWNAPTAGVWNFSTRELGSRLFVVDEGRDYILKTDGTTWTRDETAGSLGFPQVETYTVVDATTSAPPGSPAVGAAYYVAPTGTGAWAGHDRELAMWNGTAWVFRALTDGDRVYSQAADTHYTADGGVLSVMGASAGSTSLGNLSFVSRFVAPDLALAPVVSLTGAVASTNTPIAGASFSFPAVAGYNRYIMQVISTNSPTNAGLYAEISFDGGATWSLFTYPVNSPFLYSSLSGGGRNHLSSVHMELFTKASGAVYFNGPSPSNTPSLYTTTLFGCNLSSNGVPAAVDLRTLRGASHDSVTRLLQIDHGVSLPHGSASTPAAGYTSLIGYPRPAAEQLDGGGFYTYTAPESILTTTVAAGSVQPFSVNPASVVSSAPPMMRLLGWNAGTWPDLRIYLRKL